MSRKSSVYLLMVIFFCVLSMVSQTPENAQAQLISNVITLSPFFEHEIIAQTGELGIVEIKESASLSEDGTVAFIAKDENDVENIFVGNGQSPPTNITQFLSPGRRIAGLQINDANKIVATDWIDFISPRQYRLRVWDTSSNNEIISGSPSDYAAILGAPTMNNNGNIAFVGLPPLPSSGEVAAPDCQQICGPISTLFVDEYLACLETCSDSAISVIDLFDSSECPNGCLVKASVGQDQADFQEKEHNLLARSLSIADDGKIIYYLDDGVAESIVLLDSNFDTEPVTIVSNTMGFSNIGRKPGISDSGKVIVFYANLDMNGARSIGSYPGKGIFASIDEGESRRIIRVTGRKLERELGNGNLICDYYEICDPFPELGWTNTDNPTSTPVFIEDYEQDSQISVIHQELKEGGLLHDTIVVSFLGKPNLDSHNNPRTGKPFLFSNETGLWSILVDIEIPIPYTQPFEYTYNISSPLPVIQVNDLVNNQAVTSISLHDPLAEASFANCSLVPESHRGDHLLTYQVRLENGADVILRSTHLDSDEDGLLDHWEVMNGGIDSNKDGEFDLQPSLIGADPCMRDLFIELDWLAGSNGEQLGPTIEALNFIESMFADAPNNPIEVHIDAGKNLSLNMGSDPSQLQGGDVIESSGGSTFYYVSFDLEDRQVHNNKIAISMNSIKRQYFGTNDNFARELVFHYGVFGNEVLTGKNPETGEVETKIGTAEFWRTNYPDILANPGNDFLIGTRYIHIPLAYQEGYLLGATIAHELGHNLGLSHGGDEIGVCWRSRNNPKHINCENHNSSFKPEYFSIMNYTYIYGLIDLTKSTGFNYLMPNTASLFGDNDLRGLEVQILAPNEQMQPPRYIINNNSSEIVVNQPWSPLLTSETVFGVFVNSYSRDDTVFSDWDHIKLDFQNYFYSLNYQKYESGNISGNMGSELLISHVEDMIGPLDNDFPSVNITSPSANQIFEIGQNLPVTFFASDNSDLESIEISFDLNGDGDEEDLNESIIFNEFNETEFSVDFQGIVGSPGIRSINLTAEDTIGAISAINVEILIIDPNRVDLDGPNIVVIAPNEHGEVSVGDSVTFQANVTDESVVQAVDVSFDVNGNEIIDGETESLAAQNVDGDTFVAVFGNVTGTADEIRTISITASDIFGNISVEDITVQLVEVDNTPVVSINSPDFISLSEALLVEATVESNIPINSVNFIFDANGNGTIEATNEIVVADLIGTRIYKATFDNIEGPSGNRVVQAFAITDELTVGFDVTSVEIGDITRPIVAFESPNPGELIMSGADVAIELQASDDVALESVRITFDVNGDGMVDGPGESIEADIIEEGKYAATFFNVFGPYGSRVISAIAIDSSGNTTAATQTVIIGDEIEPVSSGISVPFNMTYGIGQINSVAVSPDQRKAIIGSSLGFAALIDLETGTIDRHFFGHTESINSVDFSPDGSMVITGSKDGNIFLWDVNDGSLLKIFSHIEGYYVYGVNSVEFSPDGTQIIAGLGYQNSSIPQYSAWLWDVESGALIRQIGEHSSPINEVTFSPDGSQILTGSVDKTAKLWDVSTGELIRTFTGHTFGVNSVAFSPDLNSNQIVTGSGDRSVRLWNTQTGAFKILGTFSQGVEAVTFSPDGDFVFASENIGTLGSTDDINIWDAESGEFLQKITGSQNDISDLDSLIDNQNRLIVVSSGLDGTVMIRQTDVESEIITYDGHESNVNVIVPVNLSDGIDLVLTGDKNGEISLWDQNDGNEIRKFESERGEITSIDTFITSEESFLLAGTSSPDNSARLWNLDTGEEVEVFKAHTRDVLAVSFSEDGTKAFSAGADNQICAWDLEINELESCYPLMYSDSRTIGEIKFSNDNNIVAVSRGSQVLIFNVESGMLLDSYQQEIEYFGDSIRGLDFSPDGSKLLFLSGSSIGLAHIWNMIDDTVVLLPQHNFEQYALRMNMVAYSPDGNQILTVDKSGVRIWDADDGRFLLNIPPRNGIELRGGVFVAAFSTDSSRIIVAESDNLVHVQPTINGSILSEFTGGHTQQITTFDYHEGTNTLLTGSRDGTANLWNAETGDLIRTLRGHGINDTALLSVAISPDGTQAVTAGRNGLIRLWDLGSGSLVKNFIVPGSNVSVNSVAFSPDGEMIASGSFINDSDTTYEVQIWDAESGELLNSLEGHANIINSVSFSPDGSKVISGGYDNTALLWDVQTGTMLASFGGHEHPITAVSFSNSGEYVVTGDESGVSLLWDISSTSLPVNEYVAVDIGGSGDVTSISFSEDDSQLLIGYNLRVARKWDVESAEVLESFESIPASSFNVPVIFAGQDGNVIGSTNPRSLSSWPVSNQILLQTFTEPNIIGYLQDVAISPDGQSIVTIASEGDFPKPPINTFRLWSANGDLVFTLVENRSGFISLNSPEFSPDGNYILTPWIGEKSIRLWDANSGQEVLTFQAHQGYVTSASFSPSGNLIVSGGLDNDSNFCTSACASAKIWDLGGHLLQTFKHDSRINSVEFSPDEKLLITAGQDKLIRIWNVETGELVQEISGHMDAVTSVDVSSDGTKLISASTDQTVRLWDLSTGKLLHLYVHPYEVGEATFGQADTQIVSSPVSYGNPRTVYIWDALNGGLIGAVGHNAKLLGVALTLDGELMVTSSNDATARLWQLEAR